MAVVFGSPMATSHSLDVVQAAKAGAGPGVPLDPTRAYVALLSTENGVLVRVVPAHGAPPQERRVELPITSQGPTADWVGPTTDWVMSTLATASQPREEVILFLPSEERRTIVHSLLVDLSRRLAPTYKVRQVI